MSTQAQSALLMRHARPTSAGQQDTLSAHYPAGVRWLAMGAFSLAFLGWLNESWLLLWDSPILLNRYT